MVALLSEDVMKRREQNRDETAISFGSTTQVVALHFLILLLAAVIETRPRRTGAIISLLTLFLVMAGIKATPLERRGSAL
jgi:hypothetical protein